MKNVSANFLCSAFLGGRCAFFGALGSLGELTSRKSKRVQNSSQQARVGVSSVRFYQEFQYTGPFTFMLSQFLQAQVLRKHSV